jgi:hypothetical protein
VLCYVLSAVGRGQFTRLVITLGMVVPDAPVTYADGVPVVGDNDTVLASVSLGLFDARRRLRSGRWALRMFTPDVSSLDEAGGAAMDDGARAKKQFVRNVPISVAAGV